MSIDTSKVSQILTKHGDFDRPIQGRRWPVAKDIWISGDRLCWTTNAGADEAHPSKGLLEKFWLLAEASDNRILAFAKKHGLLGICEHGLPRTHRRPSCMPSGFSISPEFNGEFWEPIPVWRKFARQMFALTRVANRLLTSRLGKSEDWNRVEYLLPPTERIVHSSQQPWFTRLSLARGIELWTFTDDDLFAQDYQLAGPETPFDGVDPNDTVFRGAKHRTGDSRHVQPESAAISLEWSFVTEQVRRWLEIGNVQIRVCPPDIRGRPSVELGGEGLFGALALQLALAVFRSHGIAFCDHCGGMYEPLRRPKTGQRRFCPLCRQAGIRSRYCVADHRERVRRMKNGEKTRE